MSQPDGYGFIASHLPCAACDGIENVRWRRLPSGESFALCPDCWLDVQAGLQGERKVP